MKNILPTALLTLLISVLLPLVSSAAAKVTQDIADGEYQVDLSFSAQEDGQKLLFGKHAVLTAEEGRYTLAVPMEFEHVITKASGAQQGRKLNTQLRHIENLVQLDIRSLSDQVTVNGTYQWSQEDELLDFLQSFHISKESLAALKKTEPAGKKNAADSKPADTDGRQARSESKAVSSMKRREEPAKPAPRPAEKAVREPERKSEPNGKSEKEGIESLPTASAEPEEELVFDRTLDANERRQKHQPKTEVTEFASETEEAPAETAAGSESAVSADLWKAGGLFLLCIASGILLIVRLARRKKPMRK